MKYTHYNKYTGVLAFGEAVEHPNDPIKILAQIEMSDGTSDTIDIEDWEQNFRPISAEIVHRYLRECLTNDDFEQIFRILKSLRHPDVTLWMGQFAAAKQYVLAGAPEKHLNQCMANVRVAVKDLRVEKIKEMLCQ